MSTIVAAVLPRTLKIGVLSTYTVDFCVRALRQELSDIGLASDIYVGPFNQVRQEIMDPDSRFRASGSQITVLLLDPQDLMADVFKDPWAYNAAQVEARLQDTSAQLSGLVQKSLELSSYVICANFVRPAATALGVFEGKAPWSPRQLVAALNDKLAELARGNPRFVLLDLEALVLEQGLSSLADNRLWQLARMRWSQNGQAAIASLIRRGVRAITAPAKKVLALDLDNTLWGGVVGTDGPNGIQLGADDTGYSYREFQQEILQLHRRGILLAIVSKNNSSDAMEVLANHPQMVLRPEHFAAIRINWENKDVNLRSIAQELNVGLESAVFMDDSPVECGWIERQCPEVCVVQLPEDISSYRSVLLSLPYFDQLKQTDEDLLRNQYYDNRRRREQARGDDQNLEDYLRSLQTVVRIWEARPEDIPRIAQLTQKTNQFNLTTRRRTESDLLAMLAGGRHAIYALSLVDRFGDEGIIGVSVLERGNKTHHIETLLLSCRVIGRGVERALLARLAEDARAAGALALTGEYVPTPKNSIVKDLYPKQGFSADGDRLFSLDLTKKKINNPDWLKVLT